MYPVEPDPCKPTYHRSLLYRDYVEHTKILLSQKSTFSQVLIYYFSPRRFCLHFLNIFGNLCIFFDDQNPQDAAADNNNNNFLNSM